MDSVSKYIDIIWSKLLADDVPSDFGNVTYYGLLKDTLLIVKRLYEEWEIKDKSFTQQIDSATKLLNSAISLLNSINVSVEEVEKNYAEFTKTITEQQNTFEDSVNQQIEDIKRDISVLIEEYINTPEFEALLTAKIDEILQSAGFDKLVQDVIAKTTINFNKVNTSGENANSFISAMGNNGALLRKSSVVANRTLEKDLILNNNVNIKGKMLNNTLLTLLVLSSGNIFTIGSISVDMMINTKSRPVAMIGSAKQELAYLSDVKGIDLSGYVKKSAPEINANTPLISGGVNLTGYDSTGQNPYFGDVKKQILLRGKDKNPLYNNGISSKELALLEDVNNVIMDVIDKIYPIGAIIETTDSIFNPNDIIGEWYKVDSTKTYSIIDTKVVSIPVLTDSAILFSYNEIKNMFLEKFNIVNVDKNKIGITVTNGDSSANNTHIDGSTWADDNLYATFTTKTSGSMRINYQLSYVSDTIYKDFNGDVYTLYRWIRKS